MINQRNFRRQSLTDWEQEFAAVYGVIDSKRRPTDIWLLLVEDASRVAESVRRDKFGDALDALAHVFCWTCSFVHRSREDNDLGIELGLSFEEVVWNKYPGVCSTCAQPRCICSVLRAELEELSSAEKRQRLETNSAALDVARGRRDDIPKTLDDQQTLFRTIYQGAHYALSFKSVACHFLEEVGEVATCVRHLRETTAAPTNSKRARANKSAHVERYAKELEDELADVISWCFSLAEKLDFLLGAGANFTRTTPHDGASSRKQTTNLWLSSVLWETYKQPNGDAIWCPVCKSRPCACTPVPL